MVSKCPLETGRFIARFSSRISNFGKSFYVRFGLSTTFSLFLTVSSSTTGRFPNVRHDNTHRGTAFDDLARDQRIRPIPSKLNGTAVARDEGSRTAIRTITRGTGRRIMVGCNS